MIIEFRMIKKEDVTGENMSKIILVETDNIERYPPEISVLNALVNISTYEVVVCSMCPSAYIIRFCEEKSIKLINAGGIVLRGKPYHGLQLVKKFCDYSNNRKKIWRAIEFIYTDGDILWLNTFDTLKLLGEKLLSYKYIVHLFELIHETRYFYKFPYPKYDFVKYLRSAYKVIECEYNRACITQAWFSLAHKPVVIPNKLYLGKTVNNTFTVDAGISEQMEALKEKKIILYQGILGPERPIGIFADAVSELGDDFVMLVMSGSKMDRKYDNLYEIGFINPPNHLYVTQRAYIGILNYQASASGFSGNDCLNSIYCAPNKIYEYSRFGLPMIGNDIPGLKYTVEQSGSGICVEKMTKKKIKDAIIKIDAEYDSYKKHSFEFYNSVDIKGIIENEILNEV